MENVERWDHLLRKMTDRQQRIHFVLQYRRGAAHAVPSEILASAAGCSVRDLQREIKGMVEDLGVPVCTNTSPPHGYYLPANEAEVRAVCASLVRRALSTLARARAYDKTGYVQRAAGQLELLEGLE